MSEYRELFDAQLIEDHVGGDFVVRDPVITEIEAALDDPACRVVLVRGDPGAGKTTVMAALADRHPEHLPYFIRRAGQVVPVLLGATARLADHELPAEIAGLAGLQGCRLDRAQYEADIRGLAESLMAVIPGLTPKPQTAPQQQDPDVEVHVRVSEGDVTGVSHPLAGCPSGSAAVWVDQGTAGSRTLGEYVRDDPGSGGAGSERDT